MINNFSETGTVFAILVITYFIGMVVKQIKIIKDEWIPLIVGAMGGILGCIGFFIMENYPANDILNAIAVGIVSGLASTGVNQIYKQGMKEK